MTRSMRYVEKCTGGSHSGEAWIAHVKFSKSKRTVYFDGKALKKFGRGMYYDIESSEEYWVSGVKKRGSNRHWAGSGRIMIDEGALNEFMELKGITELTDSDYSIVRIRETTEDDIRRLHRIENEAAEECLSEGMPT